eukprot:CAMPEP_0119553860 /NCGR_PEP_ID=MMETSP1352-20130426/6503_1 /TAXON_ID=265584 /ORGANISM="Stauroneis constricta, Strain CCMP1120" /LENGTH=497 /DNA_ID=CAMNT_0007600343 /DNA_START=39 /DNA_END=1532 /DNA_ORIENTATION=+
MAELKKAESKLDEAWTRYNQIRHDANHFYQESNSSNTNENDDDDKMDVENMSTPKSSTLPYVPSRRILPPETEEEKSARAAAAAQAAAYSKAVAAAEAAAKKAAAKKAARDAASQSADDNDNDNNIDDDEEEEEPLPPIPPPPPMSESEDEESDDGDDDGNENEEIPPTRFTTLQEIVHEITSLQQFLINELHPKRERFSKRLMEKDPVTKRSRFNKRTKKRVRNFLKTYYALVDGLSLPKRESTSISSSSSPSESSTTDTRTTSIIQSLQQQYTKEKAERDMKEQKEMEERRKRHQEEAQRVERERKAEKEKLEKERVEKEEAERKAQELLHQQAEVARQERMARESEERAWTSRIKIGKEGIQHEIAKLKDATKDDKDAQNAALKALYQLFSQIQSHPENVQFRRIRRDHEQFQQDIGRHDGGREVLIAAGFVLGAIDEIPCFISKEPDIEKDMDGWSAWFDLQKAAFDILKEETERIEEEKKLARRRYYAENPK